MNETSVRCAHALTGSAYRAAMPLHLAERQGERSGELLDYLKLIHRWRKATGV